MSLTLSIIADNERRSLTIQSSCTLRELLSAAHELFPALKYRRVRVLFGGRVLEAADERTLSQLHIVDGAALHLHSSADPRAAAAPPPTAASRAVAAAIMRQAASAGGAGALSMRAVEMALASVAASSAASASTATAASSVSALAPSAVAPRLPDRVGVAPVSIVADDEVARRSRSRGRGGGSGESDYDNGGDGGGVSGDHGDDDGDGDNGSPHRAPAAMGFDRLDAVGLDATSIAVLRLQFLPEVQREMGPEIERAEGESEAHRLLRMEDAWMRAQGPFSDFAMNVRPLVVRESPQMAAVMQRLRERESLGDAAGGSVGADVPANHVSG